MGNSLNKPNCVSPTLNKNSRKTLFNTVLYLFLIIPFNKSIYPIACYKCMPIISCDKRLKRTFEPFIDSFLSIVHVKCSFLSKLIADS